MEDILFDSVKLVGVGESTRAHQEDILIHPKGDNKFNPHLGVGITDFVEDDGSYSELVSSVNNEFERDGMKVRRVGLTADNKIYADAKY